MLRLPNFDELKNGDLGLKPVRENDLPKLSAIEERFVAEYLVDRRQTRAAIRAGYSMNGIYQAANRVFSREDVRMHIEWHLAQIERRYAISRDRMLREMAAVAFANMDDYLSEDEDGDPVFDYSKTDRMERGVISEISIEHDTIPSEAKIDPVSGEPVRKKPKVVGKKIKFKLHDKIGALKELWRYMGYEAPTQVDLRVATVQEIKETMSPQEAAELYARTRDAA